MITTVSFLFIVRNLSSALLLRLLSTSAMDCFVVPALMRRICCDVHETMNWLPLLLLAAMVVADIVLVIGINSLPLQSI